MTSKDFVHLHLHTDYSLLDGAIQIKPLAKRANELGMKSVAVTDHGNMFGAISFYNAMKALDIKPIIGCEAYLTLGSMSDRGGTTANGEKANFHIILLAKNLEGYHNLARLTSKSYTEGFYYKPRIDRELLAANCKGLIGLSACMSGVPSAMLARERCDDAARAAIEFQDIFGVGNYFLEIQEHGLDQQAKIRKPLVELSKRTGIPLVATNDAHYLSQDDAGAHDVLLCIGSGKTIKDSNRLRYGTPNFYVRSADEMWDVFGQELPDALNRTFEIAEMCDLKLPLGVNYLPNYPIPAADAGLSADEYFEKIVREGFALRKKEVWDRQLQRGELRKTFDDYEERISLEIAMIKQMKFPGYFLIVWDFIRYARDHNIPVGPGRGSAAGSLVAYCLGITDIDPLQYDLLFERFLNPERVSMPDIDIDFCVRGRGEVINHVAELYGRDSVCQIITFGTMASKAAIKDVGRALDIPYAEVDRIAKLIPPPVRGRNVSIDQALEQVTELRREVESNAQVRELIDLAKRLEGCARHSSVHAAGVVISPMPLQELIPVAVSSKDELTTQYAMSDLEKTGMLKMDFLALTALTVISDCLLSIKRMLNTTINWTDVRLDDEETMSLFSEGRTDAIFQFESSGMQEICRKLRPRSIEDLAALNALYRPGPLDGGMVEDFIERHHGVKSPRYLVPEMREILSNTHGIIVYQEQIMQLAQKLGGYSLGEADLMRRAMGKKNREEMAVHEEKFVTGAIENGIREQQARQIFSLMAQFADYGFNRSHSVAYAYLAFQTAFLKAHYPEHFYAAVLSNESQDSTKLYKYSSELRTNGIKLLPPDINESGSGFTPLTGAIRFGLAALKGVGQTSVDAILQARRKNHFSSLLDLVLRVGTTSLNKRVLESLIAGGALDSVRPENGSIHKYRAELLAAVDSVLSVAAREQRHVQAGQDNLFGDSAVKDSAQTFHFPDVEQLTHEELLAGEKSSIGFYISGHPLDTFSAILAELKVRSIDDLIELPTRSEVCTAGIISGFQVRTTKKGSRFGLFRLEDQTGSIKCVAWPEVFSKNSKHLAETSSVIVNGKLEVTDDGSSSVIVQEVLLLNETLQQRSRLVTITLPKQDPSTDTLNHIFQLIDKYRGDCDILIEVLLEDDVIVQTKPHSALRVKGSLALEDQLAKLGCTFRWSQVRI